MKQITFAVFVVLVVTAWAYAQCSAPRYRIGKVLGDNDDGITMQISIGVADFAPQRLLCLAGALKQRYGDRKSIWCGIFSDRKVAEQYVLLTGLDDPAVMFKRNTFRHAIYSLERGQSERLYLSPDPLQSGPGSSTDTIINLRVVGTPQCKIQLNGRCLLVLPTIWPFRGGSGSVTLAGKVAPNGRVGGVHVIESHLSPGEEGDFLKSVAIQNLKAWRFEAVSHPDTIRMTYEFRYTPPRPGERSYHVEVQMEQPDKSVVQINLSFLKP
jgi:hypothetical protein